jgi:hypothetical protein
MFFIVISYHSKYFALPWQKEVPNTTSPFYLYHHFNYFVTSIFQHVPLHPSPPPNIYIYIHTALMYNTNAKNNFEINVVKILK